MATNTEYEARVLDININAITQKLKKLKAKKVGEYSQRRYVFDVIPQAEGKWLRLRTNGIETTLTYKSIANDGISGTKEWETRVDNFETTLAILEQAGLRHKGYQENRRTEYSLPNGQEICIDEWPLIPPYLEIEGQSKSSVLEAAALLSLDPKQLTGENTIKIYRHYGIELDSIAELRFE
jgi:adenylate cyclase, class 2